MAAETADERRRLNSLSALWASHFCFLNGNSPPLVCDSQRASRLHHQHENENDNADQNKAKDEGQNELSDTPLTRSPALVCREITQSGKISRIPLECPGRLRLASLVDSGGDGRLSADEAGSFHEIRPSLSAASSARPWPPFFSASAMPLAQRRGRSAVIAHNPASVHPVGGFVAPDLALASPLPSASPSNGGTSLG